MREQPEQYSPFIEDDEPWERYLARMKKDGTWAGHVEVVAASRALKANFSIYQSGSPVWVVKQADEPGAPMLHLAYDGQHYDSVRMGDDCGTQHVAACLQKSGISQVPDQDALPRCLTGPGPPKPIVFTGTGVLPAPAQPRAGDGTWGEREEARVRASTLCSNPALIRAALEAAHGDVDSAVERVSRWRGDDA